MREHSADLPPALKLGLLVPLGLIALVFVAYLLGVGFGALEGPIANWAPLTLEVGGALACALRAIRVREERRAWTLIAVGASLWAIGEAVWRVHYTTQAEPPIPSLSDLFWLAFYPFVYAGIVILIRERTRQVSAAIWTDGVIAALAVGAVASAVVLDAVADRGGPTLANSVNLLYVVADAVMIGLILVAFAINGWRLDRAWAWLGGALAIFAVSDSIYLYEIAKGTYSTGGPLDAGWAIGLLLLGIAAWHTGPPRHAAVVTESWRSIALPIGFGLLALGVEVYDHFSQVTVLALALATACLAAVLGRLAMTFGQNLRMLGAARSQARTDALTGIGNRRQLLDDLEQAVAEAEHGEQRQVLMLDLDDFKSYNDSHGHPAGDALLSRLGRRLEHQLAPWGRAYRLGGDEFCAILRPGETEPDVLASVARAALSEHHPGRDVGSSVGWALVPGGASGVREALRLADRRLYEMKRARQLGNSRHGAPAAGPERRVPHAVG
jgi:diguanylate cyclase (GGDEF)-like protein